MEVVGSLVCCVIARLDRHLHIFQRRLRKVCVIMCRHALAAHADAPEDADEHLSRLNDGHKGCDEGGTDAPDHGKHDPEDEVACSS